MSSVFNCAPAVLRKTMKALRLKGVLGIEFLYSGMVGVFDNVLGVPGLGAALNRFSDIRICNFLTWIIMRPALIVPEEATDGGSSPILFMDGRFRV